MRRGPGLLLVLISAPVFADDLPAPSIWDNQSGSILTIDSVDAGGHFTGHYVKRGGLCLSGR